MMERTGRKEGMDRMGEQTDGWNDGWRDVMDRWMGMEQDRWMGQNILN